MLLSLLNINNLKTYAIIAVAIAAVWFYKDYKFQKSENIRQSANIESIRKQDSLRFASQTYSKDELEEFLEYSRKDLNAFLKKSDIKIGRIQQIITQELKYKDTVNRSVSLQPILDAIKNQKNLSFPITDSTKCMIIKGFVVFENDTLSLNITDRQFKNKSDVVSYWERNQWKLLGIKTRLFGKKSTTVIIKDDCGRTETFVINAKKKQ